jgi:hypothetical protein
MRRPKPANYGFRRDILMNREESKIPVHWLFKFRHCLSRGSWAWLFFSKMFPRSWLVLCMGKEATVSAETFIYQEFRDVERDIQNISQMSQQKRLSLKSSEMLSGVFRIFHHCVSGNVCLSRVQRCWAGYSEYFTVVLVEMFISQEFRDVERDIQTIFPMSQQKHLSLKSSRYRAG